MTEFIRSLFFYNFKLDSNPLFPLTPLLHLSDNVSPLQLLHSLIFTGITIPLLNDFFHDLGNKADIFLPSNISKN